MPGHLDASDSMKGSRAELGSKQSPSGADMSVGNEEDRGTPTTKF